MSKDTEFLLVLSTCPGSISAKNIAQDLISEKLAACVNIVPEVSSFFSWVGKIDSANEYMLVIKTKKSCYSELEERIKKLHPYELPEIIAVPIHTGFTGYLDWISNNTK